MPPKAILVIDNCSAHAPIEELHSEDGNIVAFLLPPNVTAAIQPMDQNPIKMTKLIYRNKLLSHLVAQDDVDVHEYLKQHKISDAIVLLKQAWDELSQSVVAKSWNKIMNWDSSQFDEEDDLPLSELVQQDCDYMEILQQTQMLLSKIAPNNSIAAGDIDEWNDDIFEEDSDDTGIETDVDDSDNDVEMNGEINEPRISYSSAIESVNNLLKWCGQTCLLSTKHMSNLLAVRSDIVVSHLNKTKKQSSITDFMTEK